MVLLAGMKYLVAYIVYVNVWEDMSS